MFASEFRCFGSFFTSLVRVELILVCGGSKGPASFSVC